MEQPKSILNKDGSVESEAVNQATLFGIFESISVPPDGPSQGCVNHPYVQTSEEAWTLHNATSGLSF